MLVVVKRHALPLHRAVQARVGLVFVQSFNEWMAPGEELDPDLSNDIEPSRAQVE